MSQLQPTDCIDCQKILKHWIEFQLVDEQGEPLAGMPYKLVSISNKKDVRTGVTNGEGLLREENLPPTPVRLWIDAQKLADEMELRPLRTVRGSLGSKVKPKARTQGHFYRYIKIGDLCDKAPQIDNWNNKEELPKYHFPDNKFFGFKAAFVDARWILEVCPFRAWVLLLHHQKEYSLVNAYNQGLMSVLAYANATDNGDKDTKEYSGSVFHFFKEQLLDLSRLPNRIEQKDFRPIVYDAPFRERYITVEFIDTDDNLDTQMFYVVNNKELIISWRGTESKTDIFTTDLNFKPVKLPSDFIGKGRVHEGFWKAFWTGVERKTTENNSLFKEIKELTEDRKIFICGHSLGGALALIHSAQLKKYNPCLYTYGMPRVFTYNAIMEIQDIIHYRHINRNDLVPGVPFEKDMNNYYFENGWDPMGYAIEALSLPQSAIVTSMSPLTAGLTPVAMITSRLDKIKTNDLFLHQGEIVHLYKGEIVYGSTANIISPLHSHNKCNTVINEVNKFACP
ncbi:lipase family protein [Xenorhabdus bovienii]|uniref:Lipase family protein n=1 Tax=Xenorhabdus bovienii TaxID=40576 RepID=A0AAJ1JBH4_XENBV|nr:lipase family protein [Xenorhabdus bovienii]MDE1480692.1 lipase family protein [Xenorhabdus bovienii]MDE1497401.1 lipase family protein [Xenorhabdus bovienii]MDE9475412.1 lipase family protein [Xenorhabdus bovienii]MDE9512421.1 lipase family protein [Xenorhabdus bovienii]MDE9524051.1 lipase family protein [Xenorhabdus bovienii]